MINDVDNDKLKQEISEKLEGAIDAENTLSRCCNHLFSLMHNGKIRSQFQKCSNIANENMNILRSFLKDIGIENFVLEDKCKQCKITPESFSLAGAITLSSEIIDICIRFYKELMNLNIDKESKNLFNELIKEKSSQKNFLKKESEFVADNKEGNSVVDYHCLPQIASKIWK